MSVLPPTAEQAQTARRRALLLWTAQCVTVPVLWVMIEAAVRGRLPLSAPAPLARRPAIVYILLGLAVVDLVGSLVVRAGIFRRSSRTERPQRFVIATVIGAGAAEAAALLGVLAYSLTGRPGDFYQFAVLAFVGFAASYPRRSLWPPA